MTEINTKKYENNFSKISHYQKHPQMMPFVGSKWGEKYKKMLMIAESHYLPKPLDDIQKWYKMKLEEIQEYYKNKYGQENKIVKQVKWATDTSRLVNEHNRDDGILKNISRAIQIANESLKNENIWEHLAYINYFQRPSNKKGKSVKDDGCGITKEDRKIAKRVVNEVIKIIEPDSIFFVSRLAYKYNCKYYPKNSIKENYPNIKVGVSCHPQARGGQWTSSSYYYDYINKKGKSLSGEKSFISFIKANKIFK